MPAKYEEPKIMQEIHAIREKHYEETKHMTSEEYVKSVHEEVKRIMEKHNVKFKIEEPKH
jgi:protein-disulfide isomerase-like protein with CxxC motif